MEHEPEPRKTLAQDRQDALGVDNVVERHDRIISEPDKGTVPRKARPHLCLEPLIKHIVQEDVGEAWRDHTALGSALSRAVQEAVFDGPCFQPLSVVPDYVGYRARGCGI